MSYSDIMSYVLGEIIPHALTPDDINEVNEFFIRFIDDHDTNGLGCINDLFPFVCYRIVIREVVNDHEGIGKFQVLFRLWDMASREAPYKCAFMVRFDAPFELKGGENPTLTPDTYNLINILNQVDGLVDAIQTYWYIA